MAVVHVKEITGRDSEEDMQSNKKDVRVFQALTSDPTDGAKLVLAHPDIPAVGDPWETYKNGVMTAQDLDTRCVLRTAVQSDGENHQNWVVTCRYMGVGNPTLEPPKVSWSEDNWQETSNVDFNGNPVVNSAGEFFESGLTRDRTRGVVIIEQNVLDFDPIEAEQYRDTVNLENFLSARHPPGFPAGQCKIMSISAVPVFYPNYPQTTAIHYWRRTVKVAIDRNGWSPAYVDAGFCERVAIGGVDELLPIIAKNGQPATTPQLLDGAGIALPPGSAPIFTNPFQRYEFKDWSALNIEY